MTESTRESALASRHRALGSDLEDWNGMGTAWSYHSNPEDEHDAVREAAGLIDMSPLKKVYLRGPDAAAVVEHTITRDTRKIKPGHSAYTSVLTEQGTVADDAIVSNNGDDEWTLCHGSGSSMEMLSQSAKGRNVSVELDDDLHDVALQGPKSLEFLASHCNIDLAAMPYFHHQKAELFGRSVRISRTGYSGERGYEIFADAVDIGEIWDNVLGQGATLGIMPASFTALDKVRIEAGLLFYGYDMTAEHTPWEVGLGFTVSSEKSDYRGKEAVMASHGQEKFQLVGLVANHSEALVGGEIIKSTGQEVGVVNSPCWSHRMNGSLALGHVAVGSNHIGTEVEIVGDGLSVTGKIAQLPFYDQDKSLTHA